MIGRKNDIAMRENKNRIDFLIFVPFTSLPFARFKRFNNKYITPFLVREQNIFEPKILETYSQIRMQEALENMSNSHSANNIESFTGLLRNAVASQQ